MTKFYQQADRYLHQEEAIAIMVIIQAIEGKDSSKKHPGNDKGKRKADEGSGEYKRHKTSPKYTSFYDLIKTLEKIYLNAQGSNKKCLSRENQLIRKEDQGNTTGSMSWIGMTSMTAGICVTWLKNRLGMISSKDMSGTQLS